MITTGLMLGTLSLVGFYVIFLKLPHRVKKWLCEQTLFTDIMACFMTFWIHGVLFHGGITALFAAAVVTLETSLLLAIANDPELSDVAKSYIEKVKEAKIRAIAFLKANLVAEQVKELNV